MDLEKSKADFKMITKILFDNEYEKVAYQVTLRAILLKINSEKAHNLMKDQVLDQIKIVWRQVLKREVETSGEDISLSLIDRRKILEDAVAGVLVKTERLVDGIFEEPNDVANLL